MNQKMLFSESGPKKQNQTVYYLSVSAMQKCIRRGYTERAVNFAKAAYRQQPYRAFCRLWTILFEDCGTSRESLQAFRDYPIGDKTFEKLIPLIVAMSEGVKDQQAVSASDLIKGSYGSHSLPPVPLYQALKNTEHKSLVEWYKQFPERGVEIFDLADYDSGDDWIPELCKLGAKFDRSGFSLGVGYLFGRPQTWDSVTPDENETSLTFFDEFFPLEALDIHTRQGQFAYSVFLKNTGWGEAGFTRDSLGDILFYLEGAIHNKSYRHSFDCGIWFLPLRGRGILSRFRILPESVNWRRVSRR